MRFALVLVATLSSLEGRAQGRVAIDPSVTIAQVYDDNLFFSAEDRQSDLILRVSPTVAVQAESSRWVVSGTYSFDGERFSQHPDLTRGWARGRALVSARYRAQPRLELAFDGAHTNTDTPAELNITTGLVASRVRAQQLNAGPSVSYRLTPRTSARAAYQWTDEDFGSRLSLRAQVGTAAVESRLSPRDTVSLVAEVARYLFNRTDLTSSQTVRAGWTRQLDARTRVALLAGPRVTGGSAAPDVSVSLSHTRKTTDLSVSYVRTETTVIGHRGTVGTRSLGSRLGYHAGPWQVFAAPALFRSTDADRSVRVWRIEVGGSYTMARPLAIGVRYTLDRQRGGLDAAGPSSGAVSHQVVLVTLTTAWGPAHNGPAEPGGSR